MENLNILESEVLDAESEALTAFCTLVVVSFLAMSISCIHILCALESSFYCSLAICMTYSQPSAMYSSCEAWEALFGRRVRKSHWGCALHHMGAGVVVLGTLRWCGLDWRVFEILRVEVVEHLHARVVTCCEVRAHWVVVNFWVVRFIDPRHPTGKDGNHLTLQLLDIQLCAVMGGGVWMLSSQVRKRQWEMVEQSG